MALVHSLLGHAENFSAHFQVCVYITYEGYKEEFDISLETTNTRNITPSLYRASFVYAYKKVAMKKMSSIIFLCFYTASKINMGGMAVEAESSNQ